MDIFYHTVIKLSTDVGLNLSIHILTPKGNTDSITNKGRIMNRHTHILSLLLLGAILFSFSTNTITASENHVYTVNESILSTCTFFGDSTTYGLHRFNSQNDGKHGKNYYTLQDSQIWTPSDGTFYLGNVVKASVTVNGQTLFLGDACRQYKPQKLILTVGINGLATWSKDSFLSCYQKLINTVKTASPNTEIYLQSVYPISPKAQEKLPNFTNEKITQLNLWIKELAQENKLLFLNTASVLINENGNLKENYHNGDGLHLSTQGFNAMLSYVEEQLTKGAA